MDEQVHLPIFRIRIGRFTFLLFSMLLIFVVRPIFAEIMSVDLLINILFTLIWSSAVYPLAQSKRVFRWGVTLAALTILTFWGEFFVHSPLLQLAEQILAGLYVAFLIVVFLAHIFRMRKVNLDLIFGSICVYFLIGLLWTFFYAVMEHLSPGSLRTSGEAVALPELIYFSYVTLTTLGYGDITPFSPMARSVSLLQAVTGQFYMAVIVARLVGTHISQQMTAKGSAENHGDRTE